MFKLLLLLSTAVVMAKADLDGSVISVHGSGTTNPSKCFWLIMDQFMSRIKVPTRLTYRGVGSSTGQKEFMGVNGVSANDFGSGDIPFSADDYNDLKSSGVELVQLPFLLGAISLFHSVPGVGDGLKLTSCLIAKIFNRQIIYWDDESIVSLNPGMQLPTKNYPIIVARRVLGSSSTASVTQYLHETCPADWPAEQVGSTITWANETKACDGSGPMTKCIRDFPGTIGYIDSGHGIAENLEEIELKNADGNYLTSRVAQELGGVTVVNTIPSAADQDFSVLDLMNAPGANTWPIIAMTYIYVRKDLSFIEHPEEQGLLIAFLKALYDPTYIDQCTSLFGFVSIPADIKALGMAGIEMLKAPNATEWTFETDTIPIEGQGPYVISKKRQNHVELSMTGLTSDTANLEEAVATLTTMVETMQAQMKAAGAVSAVSGAQGSINANDDSKKLNAALALGAVSIALWGCAILMMGHKFLTGGSNKEFTSGTAAELANGNAA